MQAIQRWHHEGLNLITAKKWPVWRPRVTDDQMSASLRKTAFLIFEIGKQGKNIFNLILVLNKKKSSMFHACSKYNKKWVMRGDWHHGWTDKTGWLTGDRCWAKIPQWLVLIAAKIDVTITEKNELQAILNTITDIPASTSAKWQNCAPMAICA